jgi:hypothetical protein
MIIEEQNSKIIALEKENEVLKKEVLALLEKIAELEKRLGKTNWWHVVLTKLMTWYRWSQKRKDNEPLLFLRRDNNS